MRASPTYEESLRAAWLLRGARARSRTTSPPMAAASTSVTVDVEPGPHVRLVFAGDPLPEGNRGEPGARSAPSERSIRTCSRMRAGAIENALRRAGLPRRAGARIARAARGRRADRHLHRHARTAASRRIGRHRRATSRLDRRGPRAAAAAQGRRSVRRIARRIDRRGDHRAVSRPRLRAGGGEAAHPGAAGRDAGRQRHVSPGRRSASRSRRARRRSSAERRVRRRQRHPGRHSSADAAGAAGRPAVLPSATVRSIATRSSAPIATRASRTCR